MTTPTPTPVPLGQHCRPCRRIATHEDPSFIIRPYRCGICRRCDTCGCICIKCCRHGCGRIVPDTPGQYCRHCSYCKSCCTCRSMPKWTAPARLGILGVGLPHLVNPLRRPLGIELEIGDWSTLANHRFRHLHYTVAHDWSVKPSEQEMVLAPMVGDAYLAGMFELLQALYTHNAQLNDTCALHVHVSATDLSYWEIRRLLEVYARLESDIYHHLIAPHRYTKPEALHYCQLLMEPHAPCERCQRFDQQYPGARLDLEPLSRTLARMRFARCTSDIKVALTRMLYGIDDPSIRPNDLAVHKGGRYEWCRYHGLNLHSWVHRGTVEWRMKEAACSVADAVMWPLWCGWVVQAVTCMTDADARACDLRSLTLRYMPRYLGAWLDSKLTKGTL